MGIRIFRLGVVEWLLLLTLHLHFIAISDTLLWSVLGCEYFTGSHSRYGLIGFQNCICVLSFTCYISPAYSFNYTTMHHFPALDTYMRTYGRSVRQTRSHSWTIMKISAVWKNTNLPLTWNRYSQQHQYIRLHFSANLDETVSFWQVTFNLRCVPFKPTDNVRQSADCRIDANKIQSEALNTLATWIPPWGEIKTVCHVMRETSRDSERMREFVILMTSDVGSDT